MKARLITELDNFYSLEEQWRSLCYDLENNEVFYSWEWICSFIKSFGDSALVPYIVVVEENNKEIIGIAPLCIEERNIGFKKIKVLRFIVNRTVDYYNFIISKKYSKYEVIKNIVKELKEDKSWDLIELKNLNTRDRETLMINEVIKLYKDLVCIKEESVITPYMRYEEINLKANSKQIKDIIRREKKLLREHQVEFFINAGWDKEVWNELMKLHKERWPQSVFNSLKYIEFYEDIIPKLEKDNLLEFSYVSIDNEISAIHFGFKNEEKVYYYIPIYSSNHGKTGIGAILLNKIIDNYKESHNIFDFLRGDELYKFDWTDMSTQNYNYYITREKEKYIANYFNVTVAVKKSKAIRRLLNK